MMELYDPVVPEFKSDRDFDEFLDSFLDARDVAFAGLYRDIGIDPRGTRLSLRLRWYARDIVFSFRKMIGLKPDLNAELDSMIHPEIRRREARREKLSAVATNSDSAGPDR